ncbi:unnamed protein product [Triticum turgidum subsp. durum]|uniref:Glycosyltransferase n=2 Tax=Triticum TaxID=4564 RepID=A0A9R1NMG5_TRITD|nr:unnamed protein product [Triticum turgidum subsp. durum]
MEYRELVLHGKLVRDARGGLRGAPAPRPDGEVGVRGGRAVGRRAQLRRTWREASDGPGEGDRVAGRVRRRLRRVRLLRVAAGAVTGAGGVSGRRSSAGSVAFVWAVRSGTVVPEGFEAAATAASRGMAIRGWAPQVEILCHRAVGWFLTHCGWNSVLEATAAGVAMLTWPMGADQFINASVLAEAGVAVPVAEGADAVPDAGKMASVIAAAVAKEGESVRKRAVELGRKAATVVAEGGTSHIDLEELVRVLSDVDYYLRS